MLLLCVLTADGLLHGEWLQTVDAPLQSRELRTAERRYRLPMHPGRTVTLLSVAHIGTPAYYEGIQARLDAADLVLYEGIDGGSTEFRNAEPSDIEAEGGLQADLATALGLRFQLAAIRYNRPHFRNSDLGAIELLALFHGEDATDGQARKRLEALLASMRSEGPLSQMMRALLLQIPENPGRVRGLRWSLAEVLGSLEGDLSGNPALPPDLRRLFAVLLKRRNDVVLADVREVLQTAERGQRDIVVFYGAAHMHDLAERLVAEHGAREEALEWRAAFRGGLAGSGLGRLERGLLEAFTREQIRALRPLPPSSGGSEDTAIEKGERR